ncbi:MAG: TlpA family protein disulfide reductase [Chloroflexi bacterium]|nr:TlpA family protein disulfide reductase [Chloroflexota bacterium]
MPGWQDFVTRHQRAQDFVFLSIAMDAQGPQAARPWHQRAGATFPTVVDQGGSLAQRWGFKAIPNAWVIDETGVLRYQKLGGFHIGRREDQEAVLAALALGPATSVPAVDAGQTGASRFEEGVRLLHQGQTAAALELWFQVLEEDAENWIIRKQVWQALYPDRFEPVVDYAWQREQRAREDTLGIRPANPIPAQLGPR